MSGNLYVAAAAALARARELDVVANNLANVDTSGFKRNETSFEAVLASSLQGIAGAPTPGETGRVFVRESAVGTDFGRGAAQMTSAPLDVVIDGEGFFEVQTPNGMRYTRAGSFEIDAQGQVVTPEGFALQGDGGPLSVGDRPAGFTASGELRDDAGESLGRVKVVRFANLASMEKEGSNVFRPPLGEGPQTVDDAEFVAGAVERSNVQPVTELANLVMLQRAYESALQVLAADDRATQRLMQEIA